MSGIPEQSAQAAPSPAEETRPAVGAPGEVSVRENFTPHERPAIASRPAAHQTAPFKAIVNEHPKVLIISGSPRKRSCASLIAFIEQGMLEAKDDYGAPLVDIKEFLLSEKTINPCLACGICSHTGDCIFRTKPEAYNKVANAKDRFKPDDYAELVALMDECDMLVVVSPVYFAGPPAQLKSLYDRCQPYWARRYILQQEPPLKRKAHLFFVGSGGDPHGFEPLVTISKSALQVAGFLIDKVNNYVGFCSPASAPRIPAPEIYEKMGEGQKYRLKKAIEAQQDFEQRAIFAGRAMTRQIMSDKLTAAKLQAANERAVAELGEQAAAALATLGEEPAGVPVDAQGAAPTAQEDLIPPDVLPHERAVAEEFQSAIEDLRSEGDALSDAEEAEHAAHERPKGAADAEHERLEGADDAEHERPEHERAAHEHVEHEEGAEHAADDAGAVASAPAEHPIDPLDPASPESDIED